MSWTVQDAQSGLIGVEIDQQNTSLGGRARTLNVAEVTLDGTTSATTVGYTADLAALGDGPIRFYVNATDSALNKLVPTLESAGVVTIDRTAPSITLALQNTLTDPFGIKYTQWNQANWSISVSDNALANFSVEIVNHSNGTTYEFYNDTAPSTTSIALNQQVGAWLNATYTIRLIARDKAGNMATAQADVAVRPQVFIIPAVPALNYQTGATNLSTYAKFTIRGFESVPPERVNMTVWVPGDPERTELAVNAPALGHLWRNLPQANNVRVNVTIGHGSVNASTSLRINTTNDEPTMDITRYKTYGYLGNATSDYDLYRISRPSDPACGTSFKLRLEGYATDYSSTHDVDLSVTEGDPSTIGTTGPYDHVFDGTATVHYWNQTDAAPLSEWSVLVEHKPASEAAFILTYEDGCPSGDSQRECPDPEVDFIEPNYCHNQIV